MRLLPRPALPRPARRGSVRAVLVPLALLAAACAARAGRRAAERTAERANARTERRDARLISHEELTASHFRSAYDAVEALHNNWLRPHGVNSFQNPGQVIVYLDESWLGGVETLRSITASDVAWIRFIDAPEAQARWGIGHTQGVIYVATQVGP